MGKPYDALYALRTCYVVSTSNSNRVWLPIMFVCFVSLNSYNWHNRVPKLMGVPLLTAEYHTQYIWLILLTKTYECSRHVTTPWYRCLLSSYLSSRPMAKPHPKPMSLTSVMSSPDLVASTWYMVSSRPDLDADLLRCFIALVSSAPNPLWST